MKLYRREYNELKRQKGSLTLFVGFIVLPILFFLFTISLDVSVLMTGRQRTQKAADEAVSYAYKFLPDITATRAAANLYVSQNRELFGAGSADIEVDSDSVSLIYNSSSPLTFAKLAGAQDLVAIPYNVEASARSTPLDVMIVMDTSSYLAPETPSAAPWVGPSDQNAWPAAKYFEELKLPGITPLLATQQCFNRVYSVQKRAAILIYDYLSGFKKNLIGFGFYPEFSSGLSLVRDVDAPGARPENQGEGTFDYINGDAYRRNLFCAAAAQQEATSLAMGHSDYFFPGASSKLSSNLSCDVVADKQFIVDPETQNYNNLYTKCLKVRDIIWSKAVHPYQQQNFSQTLAEMHQKLISAYPKTTNRGGLMDSPSKAGIILAGDVPHIENLRFPDSNLIHDSAAILNSSLTAIANDVRAFGANYTIYYIVFSHEGVNQDNWSGRISALKNLLEAHNNQVFTKGSFKVKLFVANDPSTIVNEILSLVLLQKRTVMISK